MRRFAAFFAYRLALKSKGVVQAMFVTKIKSVLAVVRK